MPLRTPPLAKTGVPGAASLASRRASTVEMPQPANAPATRARTGSSMRWRSTSLQLVPPAPATSIAQTPASTSRRATFAPMPLPTSLTITGTPTRAHTCSMRLSSPLKLVLPSGCTASWSALRCKISASASIISTARRHSSTP